MLDTRSELPEEADLVGETLPLAVASLCAAWSTVDEVDYRAKTFSCCPWPTIGWTNATTPLEFTPEMQSLQDVRNCLEHRGGVVGEKDLDAAGKLRLVLPTLVPFANEETGAVELHAGYYAKKNTEIVVKRISREREYALGERFAFTAQEFSEIANGCWLLSQSLLEKLPHPSRGGSA
jgi:hypothetical protein